MYSFSWACRFCKSTCRIASDFQNVNSLTVFTLRLSDFIHHTILTCKCVKHATCSHHTTSSLRLIIKPGVCIKTKIISTFLV